MEVSPYDDSIVRHVVWHHSKSESGNGFVNVPLAAFDNPYDSLQYFSIASSDLKVKQNNGAADIREYIFCDSRQVDHKHYHRRLRILQKIFKARMTTKHG